MVEVLAVVAQGEILALAVVAQGEILGPAVVAPAEVPAAVAPAEVAAADLLADIQDGLRPGLRDPQGGDPLEVLAQEGQWVYLLETQTG